MGKIGRAGSDFDYLLDKDVTKDKRDALRYESKGVDRCSKRG